MVVNKMKNNEINTQQTKSISWFDNLVPDGVGVIDAGGVLPVPVHVARRVDRGQVVQTVKPRDRKSH